MALEKYYHQGAGAGAGAPAGASAGADAGACVGAGAGASHPSHRMLVCVLAADIWLKLATEESVRVRTKAPRWQQ